MADDPVGAKVVPLFAGDAREPAAVELEEGLTFLRDVVCPNLALHGAKRAAFMARMSEHLETIAQPLAFDEPRLQALPLEGIPEGQSTAILAAVSQALDDQLRGVRAQLQARHSQIIKRLIEIEVRLALSS